MNITYVVSEPPEIMIEPVPVALVLRTQGDHRTLDKIVQSLFWLSVIGLMVLCATEIYEIVANSRVLGR